MYFFQFGYFGFYLATYMYIAIIRILFIICFLKSSLSCKVIITNKANLLLIPLKFQNLEIIIKNALKFFSIIFIILQPLIRQHCTVGCCWSLKNKVVRMKSKTSCPSSQTMSWLWVQLYTTDIYQCLDCE